jgi:hypothetical protein
VIRSSDARRVAATVLCALWWGGFGFYAARVVFIGHAVLKSRIRQGFITERVTGELNWLGLLTLAFVGWEFIASRQSIRRRIAWLAWAAALLATLSLFALHAQLAATLDFSARSVTDDDRFYGLHRFYLLVAAAQWLAGLICLVSLLRRPESR